MEPNISRLRNRLLREAENILSSVRQSQKETQSAELRILEQSFENWLSSLNRRKILIYVYKFEFHMAGTPRYQLTLNGKALISEAADKAKQAVLGTKESNQIFSKLKNISSIAYGPLVHMPGLDRYQLTNKGKIMANKERQVAEQKIWFTLAGHGEFYEKQRDIAKKNYNQTVSIARRRKNDEQVDAQVVYETKERNERNDMGSGINKAESARQDSFKKARAPYQDIIESARVRRDESIRIATEEFQYVVDDVENGRWVQVLIYRLF